MAETVEKLTPLRETLKNVDDACGSVNAACNSIIVTMPYIQYAAVIATTAYVAKEIVTIYKLLSE